MLKSIFSLQKGVFLFLSVFIALTFWGCSGSSSPPAETKQKTEKGSWDNTPKVLTPSADGAEVYSCDAAQIDASNSKDGYVMVSYTGSNPKVKMQITGPDGIAYTYTLHGGFETFPFTDGNGTYTVSVLENVVDNQYSVTLSQDISVEIADEFSPYLYPNQYVPFTADSKAVAKGSELAKTADTALEVVDNVYRYIISNITYDNAKADSVVPGYVPNVDDTLDSGTGICFDYAALIASMLRSQGIPTRLEVGYCGEEYHAWISIYTKEDGWICGIIECKGGKWDLLDPTFAASSNKPEKFIPDDGSYILKYMY